MAPAVCARQTGTSTLSKPLTRCKLSVPLLDCQFKRTITRFVPTISGLFNCYTHANCVCNELVAACGRVLGVVPGATRKGVSVLRKELRNLSRGFPRTHELTQAQFVNLYRGKKRSRYEAAVRSLNIMSVRKQDAFVNAFVKSEKNDHGSKISPDPRMIQARSPRFNVELGRYLRPMEHKLYKLKSKSGLPVIGKGLSPDQRAEILVQKWNRFNAPLCIGIDASRFDQHVDVECLKLEHDFYCRSNADPYLRTLLNWQLTNTCFTGSGVKYVVKGKRMSGDMNTAVGNCLLMYAMTRAALKMCGVHKYELFVDGDDTLIIVEQSDRTKLDETMRYFLEFGHEIKLENESTKLEGLKWCQSKFMYVDGKPKFVRDWKKVLSTLTSGNKYWDDAKVQRDIMHTMGKAVLADFAGVPILDAYGRKLHSFSNKDFKDWENYDEGFMYDVKQRHGLQLKPKMDVKVVATTRASFAMAFGLSEDEQIDIEEQIDAWEPPFGDPWVVDSEILEGWKTNYHPCVEPF